MKGNDESEETLSTKELFRNIAKLQERLERGNILRNNVTNTYHRDIVCNDLNKVSLDLRPCLSVFASNDSKIIFHSYHDCGDTAELI